MVVRRVAALTVLAALCTVPASRITKPSVTGMAAEAIGRLRAMPLAFEENRGQTDAAARFVARGPGYAMWALDAGPMLRVGAGNVAAVRMRATGAALQAPTAERLLEGRANYFIGNEPSRWITGVRRFAALRYANAYRGIDLVLHGTQQSLEYDFEVAAQADPSIIGVAFDGVDRVRLEDDGDLTLVTGEAELRFHKPIAYQDGATREYVDARYDVVSRNEVRFVIGDYDRTRELVIDPIVDYSTYLGGNVMGNGISNSFEDANAVAIDSQGHAYLVGFTNAIDFPLAGTPFDIDCAGCYNGGGDAFVAKIDPSQSGAASLVFTTYLGAPVSGSSEANAVAVDAAGNVYVTGRTTGYDIISTPLNEQFPVTPSALQLADGGDLAVLDAFFTKLDPNGSTLLYSTYIGGNNVDEGYGIQVDAAGYAYIAGRSASPVFAPVKNGYSLTNKGVFDSFFLKVDTTASGNASLLYGTLFGGHGSDNAESLAIDDQGRAFIAGDTQSGSNPNPPATGLPILNGFQTTVPAGTHAFMAAFDPSKTGTASLIYSTFIGFDGTQGASFREGGIAVDAAGMVYVTGSQFGGPFFTTPGAFKSVVEGSDVFVVKIDPDLSGPASRLASTLLGGTFNENPGAIAIDPTGNPVVVGWMTSSNFPITGCGVPKNNNSGDAFLTVFNPDLTGLLYSTAIGGSGGDFAYGVAVASSGAIYVAGATDSVNFPVTPNAYDTHNGPSNGSGSHDAFLTRISDPLAPCPYVPVASGSNESTPEDTPKIITLKATDLDGNLPAPDELTFTITQQPTKGTLSVLSGALLHEFSSSYTFPIVYTPFPNVFGSGSSGDSFKFIVNDGTFDSNVATITINISPVNDAPTADSQTVSTAEETPKAITLNATDPENNTITYTVTSGPGSGTLSGTGKNLTYTPNLNFSGVDTFQFTAKDSFNAISAPALVTINVTPANDAPAALDDTATTPEDAAVTIAVLGNDTDPDGDALSITNAVCSAGTVTINGDGTITVQPPLNVNGPISCSYTASDNSGGTATAKVLITVGAVNDAPAANDDIATTPEDVPITTNVLANDQDADGDALSIETVVCSTGTAAANADGTIIVAPPLNFNGAISCSYTVSDNHGGTATAQVIVDVTAVNDAPAALDDAATTPEDVAVTIAVLGNDTDPDGDALSITNAVCSAGTVTINGDGTITVQPPLNFNGPISCSYTASDNNGGTASAKVLITVGDVNDAPAAGDDAASTPEDTPVTIPVLANDEDADGDALSVENVVCSAGTVSVNGDGSISVAPPLNFHGTISCAYTASDNNGGTATAKVIVDVTPVNDAPVALPDAAATDDATSIVIAVLANDSDPDGDPLALGDAGVCAQGTLSENADGTVLYTPKPGFAGSDTCEYTVVDNFGGVAAAPITITVAQSNRPPVISNPGDQLTPEGTPVTLAITASDPDNDSLTFTVDGLPPGLSMDEDGSITGAPAAGSADSYVVTVSVSDDEFSASVTFTWVVTPPVSGNQPPVCSAAVPSIDELWPPNHRLESVGVLGVVDPDGGPTSLRITRILQDEPTNTVGDANTWIDGLGIGTATARIRAERTGTPKVPGDGRIYEIFFEATDASGASCVGKVTVGVPHDMGKGPAVDSGVRYDSTIPGALAAGTGKK